MDNIERNEIIENYLSGTLPPADLEAVEKLISDDPEFRAEVELQRQLHEEFADAQKLQLRDIMADILREPPPPLNIGWINGLGIAAGILLVGWIGWRLFSPQQNTPAPEVQEEIIPVPMANQNTDDESPFSQLEKTPQRHIAVVNPEAFTPNRTFEDHLGSQVRATGSSAEMLSPASGANFNLENGIVKINFRGTAPENADTAKYPLAIKIYSNLPTATQPLVSLLPAIDNRNPAAGQWTFSTTQKLQMHPGLYYFTLERQADDDLIFVGKITVRNK